MPPCLTLRIVRYVSRVKRSNPGNEVEPSLHLSVVDNEKGTFGSPSTTVTNFTYLIYMYSVLFAFTWKPMPPAASSRLCSRDSAWVGVFARSAILSVLSASITVWAGYCLLLAFSSIKPFTFIKSINVQST